MTNIENGEIPNLQIDKPIRVLTKKSGVSACSQLVLTTSKKRLCLKFTIETGKESTSGFCNELIGSSLVRGAKKSHVQIKFRVDHFLRKCVARGKHVNVFFCCCGKQVAKSKK